MPPNEAKNSQRDSFQRGVRLPTAHPPFPSPHLGAATRLKPLGAELPRTAGLTLSQGQLMGARVPAAGAVSVSTETHQRQKHQNAGWSFDIPAGSERLASTFLKSISPPSASGGFSV